MSSSLLSEITRLKTSLNYIKLIVIRKSLLRIEQQKKQQFFTKNKTIEKDEIETSLDCVELAIIRRSLY